MKKLLITAAVALLLAGCSAAPQDGEGSTDRTGDSTASAPEETPAAVDEPTPSETPWPYTVVDNADEIFIGAMRNGSTYGMEDVSDEELIEYAHEACEQMATGVDSDHVELFADEQPDAPYLNYNDINLAGIASETYCREFNHISE